NFVAKRNEQFKLKDPESITVLKTPGEKIYFTFPDTDGKKVSLSDEKYKNKVIIIQLMGSWCPNCMDETAYLSKVYQKYQNSGLEIIALAYERTDDFEKAKKNVLRLKKRFMVDYDVLITG
ncbi:MAG TPA: TlpA disulfide reductase family protein, partial [Bacteroidia bacterium]|nr:TlpA disulfide reductase family protein [Bacteroidia bacterium]